MAEQTEGKDPSNGRFVTGNRFWEHALKAFNNGRPRKIATVEQLLEGAAGYFADITDNPLYEEKSFSSDGGVITHDSPKMRAMTIVGLCNHLGITARTWRNMREEQPDLAEAIEKVDEIIFQQKLEGAAANMLNHNVINRELGLADNTNANVAAKMTVEELVLTPKERARRLQYMLAEAIEQTKQEQQDGNSETE